MSLNYLRKTNEAELSNIPNDYRQSFRYPFSPASVSKQAIMKMKQEKTITERDIKICEFLFNHTFATALQVQKYFSGEYEYQSIKNRLDKLVQNRILNQFSLGQVEGDKIEADALMIYCLDFGGKYLVSHFTKEDTTDWFSHVNYQGSENVARDLMITEFYLQLMSSIPDRIHHFKKNPQMRVNGTNIVPAFEFSFQHNFQKKYVVGEVVRSNDAFISFKNKIQKVEPLFTTNAWKKFFVDVEEEPTLFVLAEDDLTARDSGTVLANGTDIERYRLTTTDRIGRHFGDKGAFLRYLPDKNQLREVAIAYFKEE